MANELAVVTIAAKNYLSQIRTLARSTLKHNSDTVVYALIIDEIDGMFQPQEEPFITISISELSDYIPKLRGFLFQYDIMELATAVKPYFIKYIADTVGAEKIIYLDPDIYVMNSLSKINQLLDEHQIVLTPHLTKPIQDKFRPSEHDILKAGAYNLGFIALRITTETRTFLNWWAEHLYKECIVDFENNLFVDQRWIDLVPGLFGGVFILRDIGYNVAYWNLHHRLVTLEGGKFVVNGTIIVFMHFSGFSASKPEVVSKHQNRFKDFSELGDGAQLFYEYDKELRVHGYENASRWSYTWECFDNGVRIPLVIRRFYLQSVDPMLFDDPFKTSGGDGFYGWLIDKGGSGLPRLMEAIYSYRPDLRSTIPTLQNAEGQAALVRWVEALGSSELALDERLMHDICASTKPVLSQDDRNFRQNLNIDSLDARRRMQFPEKWGVGLNTVAPQPTPQLTGGQPVILRTPNDITPSGGIRFALALLAELQALGFPVRLAPKIPTSEFKLRHTLDTLGLKLPKGLEILPYGHLNPSGLNITSCNHIFPDMANSGAVGILLIQSPLEQFTESVDMSEAVKRFDSYDVIVVSFAFIKLAIKNLIMKYALPQKPIIVLKPPVQTPLNFSGSIVKSNRICSVGRFFVGHYNKRHDVMIKAFQALSLPGWELHFIGSVPLSIDAENYYMALVKAAEGLPVYFHRDASREELAEVLASSKIVWHFAGFAAERPEQLEHLALGPLEAMAFGCLPVLYDGGGLQEVVGPDLKRWLWKTPTEVLGKTAEIAAMGDNEFEALSELAKSRATEFGEIIFRDRVRTLFTVLETDCRSP